MSLITENENAALRTITEALQKIPEVLRIVLFGSRARGDFRDSSDLDVLIIVRRMNIEMKHTLIRILHNTELEYDVPISPVIYTKDEYEMNKTLGSGFVGHIENEGIILYDSEHKREGRSLAL